jgi:hypothetical protein
LLNIETIREAPKALLHDHLDGRGALCTRALH